MQRRDGPGQFVLKPHQGDVGQKLPEVVQRGAEAEDIVQKVQGWDLRLAALLGERREVGISLKVQRAARKPLFIDAIKQDIEIFEVAADPRDRVPVSELPAQRVFPGGAGGKDRKARVQNVVEIHCPAKHIFMLLI